MNRKINITMNNVSIQKKSKLVKIICVLLSLFFMLETVTTTNVLYAEDGENDTRTNLVQDIIRRRLFGNNSSSAVTVSYYDANENRDIELFREANVQLAIDKMNTEEYKAYNKYKITLNDNITFSTDPTEFYHINWDSAQGNDVDGNAEIILDLNGHSYNFDLHIINILVDLAIINSSQTQAAIHLVGEHSSYGDAAIINDGGILTLAGNIRVFGDNVGYLVSNTTMASYEYKHDISKGTDTTPNHVYILEGIFEDGHIYNEKTSSGPENKIFISRIVDKPYTTTPNTVPNRSPVFTYQSTETDDVLQGADGSYEVNVGYFHIDVKNTQLAEGYTNIFPETGEPYQTNAEQSIDKKSYIKVDRNGVVPPSPSIEYEAYIVHWWEGSDVIPTNRHDYVLLEDAFDAAIEGDTVHLYKNVEKLKIVTDDKSGTSFTYDGKRYDNVLMTISRRSANPDKGEKNTDTVLTFNDCNVTFVNGTFDNKGSTYSMFEFGDGIHTFGNHNELKGMLNTTTGNSIVSNTGAVVIVNGIDVKIQGELHKNNGIFKLYSGVYSVLPIFDDIVPIADTVKDPTHGVDDTHTRVENVIFAKDDTDPSIATFSYLGEDEIYLYAVIKGPRKIYYNYLINQTINLRHFMAVKDVDCVENDSTGANDICVAVNNKKVDKTIGSTKKINGVDYYIYSITPRILEHAKDVDADVHIEAYTGTSYTRNHGPEIYYYSLFGKRDSVTGEMMEMVRNISNYTHKTENTAIKHIHDVFKSSLGYIKAVALYEDEENIKIEPYANFPPADINQYEGHAIHKINGKQVTGEGFLGNIRMSLNAKNRIDFVINRIDNPAGYRVRITSSRNGPGYNWVVFDDLANYENRDSAVDADYIVSTADFMLTQCGTKFTLTLTGPNGYGETLTTCANDYLKALVNNKNEDELSKNVARWLFTIDYYEKFITDEERERMR